MLLVTVLIVLCHEGLSERETRLSRGASCVGNIRGRHGHLTGRLRSKMYGSVLTIGVVVRAGGRRTRELLGGIKRSMHHLSRRLVPPEFSGASLTRLVMDFYRSMATRGKAVIGPFVDASFGTRGLPSNGTVRVCHVVRRYMSGTVGCKCDGVVDIALSVYKGLKDVSVVGSLSPLRPVDRSGPNVNGSALGVETSTLRTRLSVEGSKRRCLMRLGFRLWSTDLNLQWAALGGMSS